MQRDPFEAALERMPQTAGWKGAVVDVCDTAHVCKLWFETEGLAATAADIVALTQLVVSRQQAAAAREPDP